MRASELDTMFSLHIGLERVKLQSKFPDLVRDPQFQLDASGELRFNEGCHNKAVREQMAMATLVAIAFRKLMRHM